MFFEFLNSLILNSKHKIEEVVKEVKHSQSRIIIYQNTSLNLSFNIL